MTQFWLRLRRAYRAAPRQIHFTAKSVFCKPLPPQGYYRTHSLLSYVVAGVATLFPQNLTLVHLPYLEIQLVEKRKTV